MEPIDLTGQTAFTDRRDDRELNNRLAIHLDLERAVVLVGGADEPDMAEVEFSERRARHALLELVSALRRRSYRRRPIRPVPKPVPGVCDVCDGRQMITNPYSGETFRCPVCG